MHGLRRLEVFSVCINDIDGEDEGQLYGTVMVTDGLGSQYIYNRRREDSETIRPNNDILLTGPEMRTFYACDSFTIHVDLKCMRSSSWDDEVSKGFISRNIYAFNSYNKPLSRVVGGRNGSATVNYAVVRVAVEAFVEVTLLVNGDGEDPADVYGDIAAFTEYFDQDVVLFKKKKDGYIEVHPERRIPLSRSKVVVPLNSPLIVDAELYGRHTISDYEIAEGTAEFDAQLSGTEEKDIAGESGNIRVKVTWIAM